MANLFHPNQGLAAQLKELQSAVMQAIDANGVWISYLSHPVLTRTTRIEVRRDLFDAWTATRHTSHRITRKSFSDFDRCCETTYRWLSKLEGQGMIKTVESTSLQSLALQRWRPAEPSTENPQWINEVMASFTQHNDWVDLATCLSLSVEEYIDANWRRFRDWLYIARNRHHSDQEIYAFGQAVWREYRQDLIS